jgi:flagellum-specific ATP synthase
MWSEYERVRDLVEVGAYRKGADARVDQAIIAYPKIIEFLKQEIGAVSTRSDSLAQLLQAVGPAAAVPRG